MEGVLASRTAALRGAGVELEIILTGHSWGATQTVAATVALQTRLQEAKGRKLQHSMPVRCSCMHACLFFAPAMLSLQMTCAFYELV